MKTFEQKMKEFNEEHVPYEFNMMAETYSWLDDMANENLRFNIVRMYTHYPNVGKDQMVLFNVLHESFWLHALNLFIQFRKFLTEKEMNTSMEVKQLIKKATDQVILLEPNGRTTETKIKWPDHKIMFQYINKLYPVYLKESNPVYLKESR